MIAQPQQVQNEVPASIIYSLERHATYLQTCMSFFILFDCIFLFIYLGAAEGWIPSGFIALFILLVWTQIQR